MGTHTCLVPVVDLGKHHYGVLTENRSILRRGFRRHIHRTAASLGMLWLKMHDTTMVKIREEAGANLKHHDETSMHIIICIVSCCTYLDNV